MQVSEHRSSRTARMTLATERRPVQKAGREVETRCERASSHSRRKLKTAGAVAQPRDCSRASGRGPQSGSRGVFTGAQRAWIVNACTWTGPTRLNMSCLHGKYVPDVLGRLPSLVCAILWRDSSAQLQVPHGSPRWTRYRGCLSPVSRGCNATRAAVRGQGMSV